MKIEYEYMYDDDGQLNDRLKIDGKEVFSASPLNECPEDATLERDIPSSHQVFSIIKNRTQCDWSTATFTETEIDYKDWW